MHVLIHIMHRIFHLVLYSSEIKMRHFWHFESWHFKTKFSFWFLICLLMFQEFTTIILIWKFLLIRQILVYLLTLSICTFYCLAFSILTHLLLTHFIRLFMNLSILIFRWRVRTRKWFTFHIWIFWWMSKRIFHSMHIIFHRLKCIMAKSKSKIIIIIKEWMVMSTHEAKIITKEALCRFYFNSLNFMLIQGNKCSNCCKWFW